MPSFCWWSSCSFLERRRDAAMNMITAMTIVPQMAADAAMVILSMLDAADETVRTSRHCAYGTVSGVTLMSSNDTTHTTMHSCNYQTGLRHSEQEQLRSYMTYWLLLSVESVEFNESASQRVPIECWRFLMVIAVYYSLNHLLFFRLCSLALS